jgi:hypothetical protein
MKGKQPMIRSALAAPLALLLYIDPVRADMRDLQITNMIDQNMEMTERCLEQYVPPGLATSPTEDVAIFGAVSVCEKPLLSIMKAFRPDMDRDAMHRAVVDYARSIVQDLHDRGL